MNKRIFISYKFGEGNKYRDKLIKRLGNGGFKYLGETKTSQDISHLNEAAIGSLLSDKLYTTHVTVVLITPNINESNWIPWEISYSLRIIKRANRNSSRNGIVAVVVPDSSNKYDYVIKKISNEREINTAFLPDIISNNMFNPSHLSNYDKGHKEFGSYISIYRWDEFCKDMNDIINTAYLKAENMTNKFEITTKL
jgi:hypothetical protein